MTAEPGSPHAGHKIVIVVSLVCCVMSISGFAWLKAFSQSLADTLRPVRVEEQRLGNRHARLSDPDNKARLARLGGTLEDIRLNLFEVIERSRKATDVQTLQVEFHEDDPRSSLDIKGAAATQLRLSIDSVVLHEATLLDLLATLKSATGAWPMRIQGCSIVKVQSAAAQAEAWRIRARCAIDVMHWYWPQAQVSVHPPVDMPAPSSRELQGQRLFHSERQRKALDHRADVANQGLLARAQVAQMVPAALEQVDATAANVAGAGIDDGSPTGETARASSDDRREIDAANTANDADAAQQRVPSIVFGGLYRGSSSSAVILNGVPCPVSNSGEISRSCGQGILSMRTVSTRADSLIRRLWLEDSVPVSSRGPQLRVVYANGKEVSLSAGEQTN